MNQTEFVTYLIQHSEDYPDVGEITTESAAQIISMLDRREALPAITPDELTSLWNTLVHDPAVMDID